MASALLVVTSELLIRQALLTALQVFQQALQGFRIRSRHAVEEQRTVKNFQDLRGVGGQSILAGRLCFTKERERRRNIIGANKNKGEVFF